MRFVFLFLLCAVSLDVEAQRARFFLSTIQAEQSSFDADYQDVLDYASGQGYTLPSDEQQILQNQLVLDLKDAGIWDQLDVFYVFATDGDSDYATLNWKDPTQFQCSKVNSPTFTENQGFTGNGTSSYLNSQWVASEDAVSYTEDDAGVFIHVLSDINPSSAHIFGGGIVNLETRFNTKNASGDAVFVINKANSNSVTVSNADAIGFYHIIALGTSAQLYKDNTLLVSANRTFIGLPAFAQYALARNRSGTAGTFSSNTVGCWGYGASMSENRADLYTAYTTYFTSL